MPDNPERDLEKQLRASAEQRRAEAGAAFELHEATRRMLHGEVARQYGKPQDRPEAARSWWLVFGPRLAVAAPLAVVLIVAVIWVSSPPASKNQSLLASATDKSSHEESNVAQRSAPAGAATPVPATVEDKATQPSVTLAMSPLTDLKKEEAARSDAAAAVTSSASRIATALPEAPKPLTIAAPPLEIASADATTGAREKLDSASAEFQGRRGLGASGFGGGGGFGVQPAANAPRLAESTQRTRGDSSEPTTLGVRPEGQAITRQFATAPTQAPARAREPQIDQTSQQNDAANIWFFRNSIPSTFENGNMRAGGGRAGRAAARTPATVVLNSFRFEQNGNDVRIVDEDGSIYPGQILVDGNDTQKAKEPARPEGRLDARARSMEQTKQLQGTPQTTSVNFIVTGVNRSLSQQVVFTGQLQQAVSLNALYALTVPTNASPAAASLAPKAQQPSDAFTQSQVAPASNVLLQQRVVGRARLADSRELPVDALQVQR